MRFGVNKASLRKIALEGLSQTSGPLSAVEMFDHAKQSSLRQYTEMDRYAFEDCLDDMVQEKLIERLPSGKYIFPKAIPQQRYAVGDVVRLEGHKQSQHIIVKLNTNPNENPYFVVNLGGKSQSGRSVRHDRIIGLIRQELDNKLLWDKSHLVKVGTTVFNWIKEEK